MAGFEYSPAHEAEAWAAAFAVVPKPTSAHMYVHVHVDSIQGLLGRVNPARRVSDAANAAKLGYNV